MAPDGQFNNKISVRNFFKPYLIVLKLFTHFPFETKSTLYNIYSFSMIMLIFIIFDILESLYIIISLHSIEDMVDSFMLYCTDLSYLMKLHCLVTKNGQIRKILKEISGDVFQPKSEYQEQLIITSLLTIRRCTKLLIYIALGSCVFWVVLPLVSRSGEKLLPGQLWFPFNTSNHPVYDILYIYETIAVILHPLTHICMDTIPLALMAFICGQFDVLDDTLINLKIFAAERLESNTKRTKDDLHEEMNKLLIECIIRHQETKRLANEVNDVYTSHFFAQLVNCVSVLSLIMYKLTTIPIASVGFFTLALYLTCLLGLLLLYCWYGNEIVSKSSAVYLAAYSSDWTGCPISFQKNLLFMMLHLQRPVTMYAGRFFPLSLDVYTAILRFTWSYFTLLLNIDE
nr:odorant receptor 1 [Holotrichia oblita]